MRELASVDAEIARDAEAIRRVRTEAAAERHVRVAAEERWRALQSQFGDVAMSLMNAPLHVVKTALGESDDR